MACSNLEDPEAGYATATAALIALSLALVASAVVNAGVASLKLARTDLRRAEIEMALNAAQSAALPALIVQASAPRLAWTVPSDLGPIDILAERESGKLPLEAMMQLPDDQFQRLGVADPERLRARLRGLAVATGGETLGLAALDPSMVWRACAASLLSTYGRGATLALRATQAPSPTLTPSPPGDVWRVRVSSRDLWFDERIVRLTGDGHHPAAIVERRHGRAPKAEPRCKELVG